MNKANEAIGPFFSAKVERMVGRQKEIDRLNNHLHDRGSRRFVYYYADGGLGKTRLLIEFQEMVRRAGPKFYTTGIIDLYHTDTHSTSDIERAIVEGLDPDERFFPNYRAQRAHYEMLRERGADPEVLETHRSALSDTFVADCREMAAEVCKVVICFDTIELLQYESSVMEEFAGLDTVDARVKPWLLEKLRKLNNVLVVFAGRPKKPESAHERLQADLHQAFGEDLDIVPLAPLDPSETQELLAALTVQPGVKLVPDHLLPIVHKLTRGTPILLHLIADLLQTWALELRPLFDLFERHLPLLDAPEDAEELKAARDEIKRAIVSAIFNQTGELGVYLRQVALMPKGVDEEILHHTLGLPEPQARDLLDQLVPLSFVKRFVTPHRAERLHGERVFLHEEMYDLLTLSGVVDHVRIWERALAHRLTVDYYDAHIARLQQWLQAEDVAERVALHERMHKLQVERLYYLLVSDPRRGYAEYRALSAAANYERRVGYGMRLLDEFLRFFHASRERDELRKEMDRAGITQEQVIRDSALMWVERFWWWGHYDRVQDLGQRILTTPLAVSIDPNVHLGVLGNVSALWARTYAVREGYNERAIQEAEAMLERMPPLAECDAAEALARGRLAATVGYLRRLGGQLQRAAAAYSQALAAFRKAGNYPDEYSMVLNNLAYAYALQGQFVQARTLAHEALRINEELGHDYSTGLILTTLAAIGGMRGDHQRALEYGQEALSLFHQIEDRHGTALAHLELARAARLLGKHETQIGRRPAEAELRLHEALRQLDSAESVLQNVGAGGETLVRIHAERGRTYRDLGNLHRRQNRPDEARDNYHEAEGVLEKVLKSKLPIAEMASILQDLAEALYMRGNAREAVARMQEVAVKIGPECSIVPGESLPDDNVPTECFSPLGKTELLRGQMAFAAGDQEAGLRHFLLAYAYFRHFSTEARQLDTLIQYLYNQLKTHPPDEQRHLMAVVQWLVTEEDYGVDVGGFAQILSSLLGT